jgi:hypothetical protein
MFSDRDLHADPWIEFGAYAAVALAGFLIASLAAELFVDGIVESALQGLISRMV